MTRILWITEGKYLEFPTQWESPTLCNEYRKYSSNVEEYFAFHYHQLNEIIPNMLRGRLSTDFYRQNGF